MPSATDALDAETATLVDTDELMEEINQTGKKVWSCVGMGGGEGGGGAVAVGVGGAVG